MGTWGTGIYHNDSALDFVSHVRGAIAGGQDIRALLMRMLQGLLDEPADLPLRFSGQEHLVAAEMIAAAACGEASLSDLPLDLCPTADDRAIAARAVERVTQMCDCSVGWYDAADRMAWVKQLDVLHRSLGGEGLSLDPPVWSTTTGSPTAPLPRPEPEWCCDGCGCFYTDAGSVPFAALPETWRCGVCAAPKSRFVRLG
jgi:hypothetical protein